MERENLSSGQSCKQYTWHLLNVEGENMYKFLGSSQWPGYQRSGKKNTGRLEIRGYWLEGM